jgi:UDP-glucose 4-epimerase
MMTLKNKRVLVTGGAGFIGSHICEKLLDYGAHVAILDDFSTGKIQNIEKIQKKIQIFNGNVENYDFVLKASRNFDYIIHEAFPYGISGMGLEQQYIETGVIGTYNILKASVKNDIKKVVNVSSVAAYGITKKRYVTEESVCTPFLPYGVTKLSGELYCKSFSKLYELDTINLRYFYVYGPRYAQFDHNAMVNFLSRAINDQPLIIFGNGNQVRDYTYIDDIVDGTLLALNKNESLGKTYNISSGKGITILTLAKKIAKLVNNVDIKFAEPGDYKYSDKYTKIPIGLTKQTNNGWIDERNYIGKITKAEKELGYVPKIRIEDGIRMTANWLRSEIEYSKK